MGSNKEKIVIISENLKRVNIIDDFWDLAKECRESYYYLRSLNSFINNGFVIILEGENSHKFNSVQSMVNDVAVRFIKVENKFSELENRLMNSNKTDNNINKSQRVKEAAYTATKDRYADEINYIETEELYQILVGYIKLKEEADKLQCDILDIIIENRDLINKSLINKNPKLSSVYLQCMESNVIGMAFTHSTEEDKIDTYELFSSNNETRTELKKKNIILPDIFKIRDYSYMIARKRKVCQSYLTLTSRLLEMSEKVIEEEGIKSLNRKQYYFNVVVTVFTIIATVCSIWSLVYVIKDHQKTNVIKDSINIASKEHP